MKKKLLIQFLENVRETERVYNTPGSVVQYFTDGNYVIVCEGQETIDALMHRWTLDDARACLAQALAQGE